jgi:hypothetical protein
MKDMWGSGGIAPPVLVSALDGSGQLHAPAALASAKEPLVSIEYEARWAPESVWTLWGREKSLSLDRNRASAVQPAVRRYT